MAAVRERCWFNTPHAPGRITAISEDTEESRCLTCRNTISRFWIDEEPGERSGSWSRWSSKLYVIEEIGFL